MDIRIDLGILLTIIVSLVSSAISTVASSKLVSKERDKNIEIKFKNVSDNIEDLEKTVKDFPRNYVSKELCSSKHVQIEKLEAKVDKLESKMDFKMDALNNQIQNLGALFLKSIKDLSDKMDSRLK